MKQFDLPSLEMPPALARAAQVRADRQADLAQAQQELQRARAAVEVAIVEDRGAYAAARDRGADDPGPVHEETARREVTQAERRERGEALRLAHAEDELADAVAEHIDSWATRLGKVWKQADAASVSALQRLSEAEQKRDEVRGAANWVASVQASGDLSERLRSMNTETALPDGRNAGGHLHVAALMDALREYVAETGADAYAAGGAERAAAREQKERRAALLKDERPEVKAAAFMFDGGEFSLAEAERVAGGEPLEQVEGEAARRRAAERPQPVGPWG